MSAISLSYPPRQESTAHWDFKKCYKTFKVRGYQDLLPQQQFICTLDLLFSSSPRTVTTGNALNHCRDICTQCLGHWASSTREQQPFVSFQLSSLETMPAALFWLSIPTNKLRLLPREAHSPGKLSLTTNIRIKGEGQAKSLLKDISTCHCHHHWQTPKATASASICSVSSSPWGYLFQLSIKPFTFTQGTEASVNTDFCKSCFLKYYSSTYNSNGN